MYQCSCVGNHVTRLVVDMSPRVSPEPSCATQPVIDNSSRGCAQFSQLATRGDLTLGRRPSFCHILHVIQNGEIYPLASGNHGTPRSFFLKTNLSGGPSPGIGSVIFISANRSQILSVPTFPILVPIPPLGFSAFLKISGLLVLLYSRNPRKKAVHPVGAEYRT